MKSDQVIIDIFSQPLEAQLAKIRLDTAGINSVILDENIVAVQPLYSTAVGGVKLAVSEADKKKARRILKEYREEQKEYYESIEHQCPVCKSKNIINRNTLVHNFLIILLCIVTIGIFTILWLLFYTKHKCKDCGYVW